MKYQTCFIYPKQVSKPINNNTHIPHCPSIFGTQVPRGRVWIVQTVKDIKLSEVILFLHFAE